MLFLIQHDNSYLNSKILCLYDIFIMFVVRSIWEAAKKGKITSTLIQLDVQAFNHLKVRKVIVSCCGIEFLIVNVYSQSNLE